MGRGRSSRTRHSTHRSSASHHSTDSDNGDSEKSFKETVDDINEVLERNKDFINDYASIHAKSPSEKNKEDECIALCNLLDTETFFELFKGTTESFI